MRKLSDDSKKKIIDVPYLNQLDVVFGCEAVSATMVLQFYGCDLSWRDFTDSYLIRRDWRIDNGVIYGPDPWAAYPGAQTSAAGLPLPAGDACGQYNRGTGTPRPHWIPHRRWDTHSEPPGRNLS